MLKTKAEKERGFTKKTLRLKIITEGIRPRNNA
jgi:hypothetical protein